MKLRTSLTASRDGSLVDATDENLFCDAAAAHALMLAMEESVDSNSSRARMDALLLKAESIMAGWGFGSVEVE
jgi:hypothetical protein